MCMEKEHREKLLVKVIEKRHICREATSRTSMGRN